MILTTEHLEQMQKICQAHCTQPVELKNGTIFINESMRIPLINELINYCNKLSFNYEIQANKDQLLIIFFTHE